MVSISYDTGKHVLCYQAESLKDEFDELDEKHKCLHSDYKEKCRLVDFLRRDIAKMKREKLQLQAYVQQKDTILKDYGLPFLNGGSRQPPSRHEPESAEGAPLLTDIAADCGGSPLANCLDSLLGVGRGQPADRPQSPALLEHDMLKLIRGLKGRNLNEKMCGLMRSKGDQQTQLRLLKGELLQERERGRRFQTQLDQRRASQPDRREAPEPDPAVVADDKRIELRFQLKRAATEQQLLQNKLHRIDRRLTAYKQEELDTDQKLDRLRIEKKRLLRELRDANGRIAELEADNLRNQKLIEKMKNHRLVEIRSQLSAPADDEDD